MSEYDFLNEELDDIKQAKESGNAFEIDGLVSIAVRYQKWNNGSPEEVDKATYLKTPKNSRSYDFKIVVSNPDDEWSSTRYLKQLCRRKDGSTYLDPDWAKTFGPSLVEVFGVGADDVNLVQTIGKLNNSFARFALVSQQKKKDNRHINPETGKPYPTLKLVRVYANEADYRANRRVFEKNTDAVELPSWSFPTCLQGLGWDQASWSTTAQDVQDAVNAGGNLVELLAEYGITRKDLGKDYNSVTELFKTGSEHPF